MASREKAPPTESRHIGKVKLFERRAVVVHETCVSAPRDPAARRSSSAISPACSGAADEIDETSAGRRTPAARRWSEDKVARTVGVADESELVGDWLCGRLVIARADDTGLCDDDDIVVESET